MKHITYKQVNFNEVPPNGPFYLVNPNTVKSPAIAAVHYPCESFPNDTSVWVVDEKRRNV